MPCKKSDDMPCWFHKHADGFGVMIQSVTLRVFHFYDNFYC
jgi:hypothetical protein